MSILLSIFPYASTRYISQRNIPQFSIIYSILFVSYIGSLDSPLTRQIYSERLIYNILFKIYHNIELYYVY